MAETPPEQARIVVAEATEDVARRHGIVEQSGRMGKIFGSATTPPIGVAGIIALLLTLASIAVVFMPSKINMDAGDYLERVLPVISPMVGYLFGKNT